MSAVTLDELKAIFRGLKSAEKLQATEQGREAQEWAAGPTALMAKDATMLFNNLKGKKEKIDLKNFLDTCIKCVKIKTVDNGKTPKQIEDEKRAELYAEMDWTDKDAMIATWPPHIRQQVALARQRKIAKNVEIEDFCLKVPFQKTYLLDSTELKIGQRQKLSLIGESNSGKSTLFRAMANQEIKGFPTHLEVHHMKEIEVSPDAENLLDTVVHAHSFLMALRRNKVEIENRINAVGHPEPSAEAKEKLEANLHIVETKLRENGNDRAEEEASKSLRVLGFDEVAQTKSINSLSGGLRMRVALCAAFFVEADILLLDEPTNHLDFPSLLWLENKLRSYRKTLVMVCHDREILNNVCNGVMHITDQKTIKYYVPSTFEAYEKTRDKAEKKQAADVEKFLKRHRNIDFSSPLALEASKKRKWLEDYCRKMVLRAGQFTFPPPTELIPDNEQLGETLDQADVNVIKVTNVRFSYDPETLPFIFDTPISIDISMGTRMGVMGPNGAGKSTFLKLLTGRLFPVEGTITTNKNATIGYFSQHHSAEMDLTMTPLEWMMDIFPEEKVGNLKVHLGKVGCSGGMTDTPMNDLSQGLRSCILFAKITYVCPNLLIMDEPTNFLDIETVDALINATNKYRGALLLVSHSRLFLQKCAHAYLSIVPGSFNVYPELGECEKATYTFIQDMEEGGKVKIGSGALAQHGANKAYGGSSEAKIEKSADGIMTI